MMTEAAFLTNLAPFDGELYLLERFYDLQQADALFSQLRKELDWQEEEIFIYGRWVQVPRLMCWYGDKNARYKYSHVVHEPLPWIPSLAALRDEIQGVAGCRFNSVLGNLYRDGKDSMGCHADDEPELGENPVIASLSLGASRVLKFRHNVRKTVLDIPLGHGDLLIMAGSLQHHWQHSVPKTRRCESERINLTFRKVHY